MRSRVAPLALAIVAAVGTALAGQVPHTVLPLRAVTIAASGAAVDAWERRVESLTRTGSLRLASSTADTMIDGRVHDRFDQFAGATRIFGAQIVRQRSADGVLTVFGTLHPDDLGIPLEPILSADEAVARVAALSGGRPIARRDPELVVLPLEDGTYRLTWLVHAATADDVIAQFVDARTGEDVRRYSVLETQAAVGVGTGVLGERTKLSTRQASGVFFAEDLLRPLRLTTYDMKGDAQRTNRLLGIFAVVGAAPVQSDVAADTDNTWTDGAVVDAHAGIAATYDFYVARFNRRGVDGTDTIRTPVFVHPARRDDPAPFVRSQFLVNAFFCDVCGPGEQGIIVFGEGLDRPGMANGQYVDYFSAGLDVVAHEYSHAVTKRAANLNYFGESGALNESFSDIMGLGVEFYAASTGRRARPGNYQLGEDVFKAALPFTRDGTRSASHPLEFGQPEDYGHRFLGFEDNGGVHINSGISNLAFYLAIEGGVRGFGPAPVTVQGVGAGARDRIERVFYRGFTTYLTPNATFAQARQATLRAAADLYGDSGPVFRAVEQAWNAVGVF